MKLPDRLITFSDGKEVIDYFENLLNVLDSQGHEERPVQPVSLLLLDINMPIINGIETLKQIKGKF